MFGGCAVNKKEARKRRRKKKSRLEMVRLLIGAVLLIGIIGSSVSITFANQDIQSLLTNWFDTQRGHAIDEIKGAIDTEREIQTERLKEELQLEIQSADKQLQTFTAEEKEKRISELRRYTDELINSFEIDNSESESVVKSELESIFQAAVNEMEQIMNNGNSNPESESEPEQEGEPAPESNPEPEPQPDVDIEKDRDTR